MRRSAVLALVVGVALVGALPTVGSAGWRSADRRALEDEPVVEEQHDHHAPEMWHDDRDRHDGDWHHGRRDHGNDVHPFVGTQPYWGTMRPYWNAGEPPGVIHRQPRTEPLKVPRSR